MAPRPDMTNLFARFRIVLMLFVLLTALTPVPGSAIGQASNAALEAAGGSTDQMVIPAGFSPMSPFRIDRLESLVPEAAGFTVNPTSGLITTEAGGMDTFTVVLDQAPIAPVTITLTTSDPTEGLVAPDSMTFDVDDWDQTQAATVTGQDDILNDGDTGYSIQTGAAVSDDPAYAGLNPDDVSVTNRDDEGIGISVNPTSGLVTTEAAGTDTFDVVLDQAPLDSVTLTLDTSDPSEGTVSPLSMTFETGNWNHPQPATVTGQDDGENDGDIAYVIQTGAAVSGDPLYNGLDPADVGVLNRDDEGIGFTVDPTSGLVTTESGGSDTFTVVLDQAPADSVTISLNSSNTAEGTVSPGTMTFETGDWDQPQLATITGQDDGIEDGDIAYMIVTGAAVSDDPLYSGVDPADVSVLNRDNEGIGISVSQTEGLITTESGGADTFTVVLDQAPADSVTVPLSSSDESEGLVSPASMTFDTDDWDEEQTATVTGQNDSLNDGDLIYSIQTGPAVSSDPLFNGFDPVDVSVTNLDNDAPQAVDDEYTVPEDQTLFRNAALGVLSNDLDENDPSLSASLETDVVSGTLNLNPNGSFSYTPFDNFWGTDGFVYIASDGVFNDTGVVTITVTPVNDFPIANMDVYTVAEDTTIFIPAPGVILNDDDQGDGDTLSAILHSDVLSGTLDLNENGSFEYTPASNLFGSDEFSYFLDDGELQSAPVTVTLNIDSVNDAPVGAHDQYLTNATNTIPLTVAAPGVLANDSDPENSPLTAILDTSPLNGEVDLKSDGSFVYTPTQNFDGVDFFTYFAWDGGLASNVTQVELTVDITSPPPVTWIGPVGNSQIYYVSGEIIELEVAVAPGITDLEGVRFYRWDSVAQAFVEIGFVASAPFVYSFDTSELNFAWNQIFAQALDHTGNYSEREFIWLYLNYPPVLWLPFVAR